jgi:CRISPR-associated protein Csb1
MSLYQAVLAAVTDSTAIRVQARLVTISGSRHILPPTYAVKDNNDPTHNLAPPNADGIHPWVGIDSAASFANRIERRLLEAGLGLDPLRVRCERGEVTLSTLQLPHRCFDAILRDSELAGTSFRETEIGRALIAASPADASALFRYDPAVLLLGGWESTSLRGNERARGQKWPAVVVAEISGTNAIPLWRPGGRIDPLGIVRDGNGVVLAGTRSGKSVTVDDVDYRAEGDVGDGEIQADPSHINHGNIPPTLKPKGVLVDSIQLHGSVSLARLRRYRFGGDEARDQAARALLAVLGLLGIHEEMRLGLDLRRDCELVVDSANWSLLRPGDEQPLALDAGALESALREAKEEAARRGLSFAEPVEFTAKANLETLIARSR